MEYLQHLDESSLLYLNNLGQEMYDQFWLYMSDQNFWIPMYILLFIIILQQFPLKQSLLIFVCIGLCFFFTDFIVSEIIKPSAQRLRPCHLQNIAENIRLVKGSCGGKYGFFSSHAANSFGLAILLGNILYSKYKYAIVLLVVWAILVSYSRIYLGVHYPGDVLAGALYGSLVGYLIFRLYKKLLNKINFNNY